MKTVCVLACIITTIQMTAILCFSIDVLWPKTPRRYTNYKWVKKRFIDNGLVSRFEYTMVNKKQSQLIEGPKGLTPKLVAKILEEKGHAIS